MTDCSGLITRDVKSPSRYWLEQLEISGVSIVSAEGRIGCRKQYRQGQETFVPNMTLVIAIEGIQQKITHIIGTRGKKLREFRVISIKFEDLPPI